MNNNAVDQIIQADNDLKWWEATCNYWREQCEDARRRNRILMDQIEYLEKRLLERDGSV